MKCNFIYTPDSIAFCLSFFNINTFCGSFKYQFFPYADISRNKLCI